MVAGELFLVILNVLGLRSLDCVESADRRSFVSLADATLESRHKYGNQDSDYRIANWKDRDVIGGVSLT